MLFVVPECLLCLPTSPDVSSMSCIVGGQNILAVKVLARGWKIFWDFLALPPPSPRPDFDPNWGQVSQKKVSRDVYTMILFPPLKHISR